MTDAVQDWLTTLGLPEGVEVRRTRGSVLLVGAQVVVKLHPERADSAALGSRLQIAGSPGAATLLVAPISPDPVRIPAVVAAQLRGAWRWATIWPYLEVLDPAQWPGVAVWTAAGGLLAGLHRLAAPPGTLRAGDGDRLDRALSRLAACGPSRTRIGAGDVATLLAAGRRVRDQLVRDEPPGAGRSALVHGDWHLGQLGRRPAGEPEERRWRLIDIDDLGIGFPATDLARPAAFWAVGLLDDASWSAFVEGYRQAGGPAVPATGEVWPSLDLHARAAVIGAATRSVLDAVASGAPLDDDGTALVQACHRMVGGSSARVGTRGAAGRRPG